MYELKNVNYKDILAIDHLKIPQNQVTCIVGESGSGKTTLLRLLNQLISHDEGEIYYKNQLIDSIDPINLRRQVVMLPQTPAMFEGTIKENLLIGLKFSEKELVNDSELKDILSSVNMNKPLDELTDNLSGGEQQRIALGRILLMHPETLLLDEPSSALDETTEELIIKAVVEYTQQHNKTLIMVTHSSAIAKKYGDYIISLANGTLMNREVM
jgi:putative ABC transport system ATP-binding protein